MFTGLLISHYFVAFLFYSNCQPITNKMPNMLSFLKLVFSFISQIKVNDSNFFFEVPI